MWDARDDGPAILNSLSQILYQPVFKGFNLHTLTSRSASHHTPCFHWMVSILNSHGRYGFTQDYTTSPHYLSFNPHPLIFLALITASSPNLTATYPPNLTNFVILLFYLLQFGTCPVLLFTQMLGQLLYFL